MGRAAAACSRLAKRAIDVEAIGNTTLTYVPIVRLPRRHYPARAVGHGGEQWISPDGILHGVARRVGESRKEEKR